ncbi:MAG: beta-galactosidase [Chthoniobacteraceae bacterium]
MNSRPSIRSHKTPTSLKTFLFGAPYYPEHWNEADMKDDIQRMKAAGFNVVRMAEFAWDRLEPEKGKYNLSFFDDCIAKLGEADIQTILCTPTATPPAWLTTNHPDVLRVAEDGRGMIHGSRQHACHSSPVFREYSREITKAMALHFAQNPHVAGWQTDNELFCHFSECHCENCTVAFRAFLSKKYGSIDELNHHWGTSFWALTYNSFDQILTPHANRPTYTNPSQHLDYHLFLSSEVTDFQNEQIAILREANPAWWITHNGIMDNIDYREFARELDFFGVDIYPMFHRSASRALDAAINLDRTRSFSGNFIIPELQSGPGGQGDYFHDNPRPGEMRLFSWQSIAHGADGILHFRWRTCRFGAEQYWCGILDHDNIPRRRYDEVVQEGAEFARLGAEILGTYLEPDVAVLYDSGLAELGHKPITCGLPSPNGVAKKVYRAFWEAHYNMGFVHPEDDLGGVKLVVMPSWAIVTKEVAAALETFVEKGGTLVIAARTGIKNSDSHVISQTPPGLLARVSGCVVEEATRVNEPDAFPNSFTIDGVEVKQGAFSEMLQPTTGQVVATWANGHQAGKPAVVKNQFGSGTCIYIGTFLDETNIEQLLPHIAQVANVKPLIPGLPKGVEVTVRVTDTYKLWFLLNHSGKSEKISSMPQGIDLISGRETSGERILESCEVAVVKQSIRQ